MPVLRLRPLARRERVLALPRLKRRGFRHNAVAIGGAQGGPVGFSIGEERAGGDGRYWTPAKSASGAKSASEATQRSAWPRTSCGGASGSVSATTRMPAALPARTPAASRRSPYSSSTVQTMSTFPERTGVRPCPMTAPNRYSPPRRNVGRPIRAPANALPRTARRARHSGPFASRARESDATSEATARGGTPRRAQVPGRVLAAAVRPKRLDLLGTGANGTLGRFRRGIGRGERAVGADNLWSHPQGRAQLHLERAGGSIPERRHRNDGCTANR